MQQSPVILAGVLACLCVASPCWSDPMAIGNEIHSRPTRPKVFTSPDELKTYLEQLSNFYAIAGRPRFGKRLAEPAMFNSLSGSSPAAAAAVARNFHFRLPGAAPVPSGSVRSDLYQMLFPYDE